MSCYFISDLHLGPHKPQVTELCLKFLTHQAPAAEALYILGDFFEFWLGDDAIDDHYLPVIEQLKKLTDDGTEIFFMHGNRDFLVSEHFTELTGCQLLNDPTVIEIEGEKTLLMHGDLLCSDDLPYQQFRSMVRDPAWQQHFLSLSFEERLKIANEAREKSKQATSEKSAEIMDVTQSTVEEYLEKYQVSRLIHGHTHRPAIHNFEINGRPCQRIVLADWGEQGHYLNCSPQGCEQFSFAL